MISVSLEFENWANKILSYGTFPNEQLDDFERM
jgi:hypothetical protein